MKQRGKQLLLLGAAGLGTWLLSLNLGKRYSLHGKVVVVTGGSRGLGLVIARQLTREGALVAICARNDDDLRRASDDLERHGARPVALPCDVCDPAQVQDFVEAVEARLGPVDVLINNAGTISVGPLQSTTREDFENALATHFWGAYNCVDAVLPTMRRRHSGRIVNIASIGGKIPVPHLTPYCASKFALVGYSHGIRLELAREGIIVSTVCPGLMRTGSPRNALFKGQHEKEYAWFSVSGSMPLLTMSAEQAAAQILDTCRRGQAEAVLTFPAKAVAAFFGLFPGLTTSVLGFTNTMLPEGDGPTRAWLGRDSESSFSPSALTALSERAAARNNEIAPGLER